MPAWERDGERSSASCVHRPLHVARHRVPLCSARCLSSISQGSQAISCLLLPSTSMIIWALMHTEDYKAVIYGTATKVPIIC